MRETPVDSPRWWLQRTAHVSSSRDWRVLPRKSNNLSQQRLPKVLLLRPFSSLLPGLNEHPHPHTKLPPLWQPDAYFPVTSLATRMLSPEIPVGMERTRELLNSAGCIDPSHSDNCVGQRLGLSAWWLHMMALEAKNEPVAQQAALSHLQWKLCSNQKSPVFCFFLPALPRYKKTKRKKGTRAT